MLIQYIVGGYINPPLRCMTVLFNSLMPCAIISIMSDIALCDLLKRIPNATDEEVEKAIADVAKSKEMVTKADLAELKSELLEKIADAKQLMILWVAGVGIVIFPAVLLK